MTSDPSKSERVYTGQIEQYDPNTVFSRRIIERRFYVTSSHPIGSRSIEAVLECGHIIRRRQSKMPAVGSWIMCWECEQKELRD